MKSRRNESLPIFPGRPSVQGEEFIGSLDDCPIYSPTSSRGAGVRVESKRKSAIYFLRQCGREVQRNRSISMAWKKAGILKVFET